VTFDFVVLIFAVGAMLGSVKLCEWIARGLAGLVLFVWNLIEPEKNSPEAEDFGRNRKGIR
jgi:hypothetical protein